MREFRRAVWTHWKKYGRHDLPWRKTADPYKILVSEVMLQQTQVPRVIEKYKSFLKTFPTVNDLARFNLATVLKEWSGLGYNRRGKYLQDAAKKVVTDYRGNFKKALQHPLPGVGPYTRAAVRTFAFNEPDTMIETNIRTALIHRFYKGRSFVSDRELLGVAERISEGQDPRTWHWALMDYGAYLKKTGVRTNHRSAHYVKQSKFEGSLRQARGAILRELSRSKSLNNPSNPYNDLRCRYGETFDKALAALARDGLIVQEGGAWRIA